MRSLKPTLERFYREYNFEGRILHDPIQFPHQYKNPEDIAVSGFIASCFAYGRVDLFKPVIKKILSAMGESPFAFLMDFRVKRHGRLFSLKYRFNESDDIVCLLFIIHELLGKYRSLEDAFKGHYNLDDADTGRCIAGFTGEVLSIDTSAVYGRNIHPSGLTQFFPSPIKGSACKRINLFLRWMVRDRDIDFGIWKWIPRNKLVIPLDTHVARISRCLGLTRRISSDWKAAVEITEALKVFDPEDPLKYDFALCHQGISRLCRGPRATAGCSNCVFTTNG